MKLSFDSLVIEIDDSYYRVTAKIGTHKLHSEKLNIESAVKLCNDLLGVKQ